MTTQVEELRRLTPEEFRDVIGHFASGVTVITAAHDGEYKGTTASAVSSLSLEPPMVLICLNKTSSTPPPRGGARRPVRGQHPRRGSSRGGDAVRKAGAGWRQVRRRRRRYRRARRA